MRKTISLANWWEHATPEPNTGCWLWTGSVSPEGYGRYGGQYAHRLMYLSKHGAIPDKLDLDHLCRQRCCCNPDHLEAVTRSENLRRGGAYLRKIGKKRTVGNQYTRGWVHPAKKALT